MQLIMHLRRRRVVLVQFAPNFCVSQKRLKTKLFTMMFDSGKIRRIVTATGILRSILGHVVINSFKTNNHAVSLWPSGDVRGRHGMQETNFRGLPPIICASSNRHNLATCLVGSQLLSFASSRAEVYYATVYTVSQMKWDCNTKFTDTTPSYYFSTRPSTKQLDSVANRHYYPSSINTACRGI